MWKAFGSRYSDGWLYANNMELTGQTIVYIYEDFQTAIMGQFKGGKFINGSAAKIAANRYLRTFISDYYCVLRISEIDIKQV